MMVKLNGYDDRKLITKQNMNTRKTMEYYQYLAIQHIPDIIQCLTVLRLLVCVCVCVCYWECKSCHNSITSNSFMFISSISASLNGSGVGARAKVGAAYAIFVCDVLLPFDSEVLGACKEKVIGLSVK